MGKLFFILATMFNYATAFCKLSVMFYLILDMEIIHAHYIKLFTDTFTSTNPIVFYINVFRVVIWYRCMLIRELFDQMNSNTHTYIHMYIEVKLTFEMLTVRLQQHSFSTHERMSLWKFLRQQMSPRGTINSHLKYKVTPANVVTVTPAV